jgi:hypothetical protein
LADYHGDGRLDLLSGQNCCQHPFGLYVYRRLPEGKFAARKRVNLRFPPEQFVGFDSSEQGLRGQTRVAVADWNGDGIPDLLVLVPTRTLGIVYGPLKGKDELTVERLWPNGLDEPSWLTDTTSLCVVDWDGDGLPDLVIGGPHGVSWLRNVGTRKKPQLDSPRLLIASPAATITGIAVADWDGDGRPDLIVSRLEEKRTAKGPEAEHHKVWVYLRKGQGREK